MDLNELILDIPLFKNKEVVHEPLIGGFSNLTYRLTCDGRRYILRVFGQQTEFLPLSRRSEIKVMQAFHSIANSPAVLHSDSSGRYVLLEYIEGRQVTGEDLQDPLIRQLVVSQMKAIHDSADTAAVTATAEETVAERQLTPYQLIESYLQGSDRLGVKRPNGLDSLLRRMEGIAYSRSLERTYTRKFCHNDYYLFNLVWSPEAQKLHVLDWELSGVGDVYFDLASVPITNGFSAQQEKEWLQAYFGYCEEEQIAILQDMKFMNMLRECTWGLLHSGLVQETAANQTFDYYKHAEYVIERLEQGHNQF